jgi:nicotinamidase-related amidase
MGSKATIRQSLIDVDDSVLIAIDIQDHFLSKYDAAISQPVLEKVVWLVKLATYLDVPIVAMGEDIEGIGTLHQSILDALPDETKVHNKLSFGLADQPEILASVQKTGRNTAILIGMETDVCVAQSALGLMENGYQVVVARDAVITTVGGEVVGLNRMHDAGAVISSVKAIHYAWLRTVENTVDMYEAASELGKNVPDSLDL